MTTIKCPNCGTEFPIEEDVYQSIVKEVRNIPQKRRNALKKQTQPTLISNS